MTSWANEERSGCQAIPLPLYIKGMAKEVYQTNVSLEMAEDYQAVKDLLKVRRYTRGHSQTVDEPEMGNRRISIATRESMNYRRLLVIHLTE